MSHRVLVVDDDDGIRRLVSAVLRRHEYETDEASDGQQAIDKLAAGDRYEAMFLDLMMPIRNGYEVLDYLRQHEEERKCVVVMTAAGTRGTKLLDETFVHSVLHKPFDIEDVISSAEACIGKAKA